jgi:hypothetical protein
MVSGPKVKSTAPTPIGKLWSAPLAGVMISTSSSSSGKVSAALSQTPQSQVFFMDLDVESYFGYETDTMPAKQLRQLQLDDPRITDEYRQQLHTHFTNHSVYRRVKKIIARGKSEEWSIVNEEEYEKIDLHTTRSMLSAVKKCGSRSNTRLP